MPDNATPPPLPGEPRELHPFVLNVSQDPGKDFRPIVERLDQEPEVQLPKGASVVSEQTGQPEATADQPELIFEPESDTAETATVLSTPPPPPSSSQGTSPGKTKQPVTVSP